MNRKYIDFVPTHKVDQPDDTPTQANDSHTKGIDEVDINDKNADLNGDGRSSHA